MLSVVNDNLKPSENLACQAFKKTTRSFIIPDSEKSIKNMGGIKASIQDFVCLFVFTENEV